MDTILTKQTADRQQRIRDLLLIYCTPQARYDGMTAWELAGKVLAALEHDELATGRVQ